MVGGVLVAGGVVALGRVPVMAGGVPMAVGGVLVSPAVVGWDEGVSTPVMARQRFVQAVLKPQITSPTLTSMRSSTKRTPWKWSGMATLPRMRR